MVRILSGIVAAAFLAFSGAFLPGAPVRAAFAQEAMVLPADPAPLVATTSQGRFPFTVEIADEPGERSRGLMFREEMASNHAMLFDFGGTRQIQMWMKNTPMALDMVFIRPDGTVARVAERTVPYSEDVVASGEPVSYVLELRAGVARMIGLKKDDRLEHPLFSGSAAAGTTQ